jgi:hypothetical protein
VAYSTGLFAPSKRQSFQEEEEEEEEEAVTASKVRLVSPVLLMPDHPLKNPL